MKIKSKPAVKTVAAKKTRTAVKKAAPKAAAKPVEKSVTFTVHAEAGKSVYLAGSFNNWDPAGKKMLEKKSGGVYAATV
ncbi:MAG: glycogen-binding domain-containing protein, partial [Kiritimatiellae bacterium]|nr:glycogen-binding domain-containing protein [Kiritimatiellia bacterium]